MKRLPLLSCAIAILLGLFFLWVASQPARGDYFGSWKIDDYVPISVTTHRFSTGAAYAPTVLTYSIYEDANGVGLDENVDMVVASPFDSVVGFYLARRQLTVAAGFEKGKNYIVLIKATVDSVAAVTTHTFQIEAEVDADTVSDKSGYALTQTFPTNFSALAITAGGIVSGDIQAVDGNATAPVNMLTIFYTDWITDYNTTTNTWNVNVQTVKNETPEADVVDTLLDVNDNLKTEIAAVQSTADTIEGYTDDISTLQTTMDDANDATAILKTRLPQTLTMAQIGGAGSYYVKVIEPNGLGVMAHGESVTVDVNGIELDANDVMAAVIGELIIQDTTVAVAGTASTFTLTAGKASADAYAWHLITVTDANDSNKETRLILTYTAGRVVTVNEPFSFTPAAGDIVKIWAIGYFRRARNPLTDPTTY